MSKLQVLIYESIKYNDPDRLVDLGVTEQTDINFKIEVEKGRFLAPLIICAALGLVDCLKILLQNPGLEIDTKEEQSGVNSFWIAAFYGRGEVMGMLAEAKIDILNQQKNSKMNALHISLLRKHYRVSKMLIKSGFPLNDLMTEGISPLILCSHDKNAHQIAISLIHAGANID